MTLLGDPKAPSIWIHRNGVGPARRRQKQFCSGGFARRNFARLWCVRAISPEVVNPCRRSTLTQRAKRCHRSSAYAESEQKLSFAHQLCHVLLLFLTQA